MTKKTLIICFLSFFIFSSCKKADEPGSVQFNIKLSDSPANYQEVNIDFQRARVFLDEAQNWITIDPMVGFYDLLQLNNGRDTLIASRTIPTGTISEVWLILGTNNTIKVNGQTRPLIIPGAEQASIFIRTKIYLENNKTYTMLLDFDAALSVVEMPNGVYHLYPVVRDITASQFTGIRGVITPTVSNPVIYAISGTDSISTYPDSTGNFLIRGLSAGDYNVYFKPKSLFNDTTVIGVSVLNGLITDMDTIPIP
ncbi:MAG: DUF4382 domain-containing protein [Bacteroidia bacterium]